MTTVSVQPTKNEQNEREAFEDLFIGETNLSIFGNTRDYVFKEAQLIWKAWQHQQQRIDELEEELSILKPHPQCDVGCMLSCKMEADAFEHEHERAKSLQAQLTIAVEALEEIGSANWHFSMSRKLASEALAEIKKIGR